MITVQEFADRAIVVPFEEFGRSYDGWDCWGIPVVGYRDVLGVGLPDQTDKYSSTRRRRELRDLIDTDKVDWVRVDRPQAMDCALLLMYGLPCHIGLMLNETDMLHVEEKCMTMVEDVNRPPWRSSVYDKVEGFYRHVSQF